MAQLLFPASGWLVCVLILVLALSLEGANGKKAKGVLEKIDLEPYWSRYQVTDDSTSMSYLWSEYDVMENPRISFMNKIVKMLHAIQHPSREECKQRKLLVLQMRGTSFEGTGSLLKQVLLGIAVAAHSNRTLVWGLGLPYIYEHTQDIWQGENNNNVQFHSNSITVDCSSPDPTGGAYKCFFEQMTGCTLADASPSDIISYSKNCYNDTDRLMVGEVSRRGVALFHPPEGLFEYILNHQEGALGKGKFVKAEDIAGLEPNLWVSAVAAYVFRLKPSVVAQYMERYESDFGPDAPRPLWGFHVRHGDLTIQPKMYRYKTVFGFNEFFGVARDLSHIVKTSPKRLFISSDSPDVHHVDDLYTKFLKDDNSKYGRHQDFAVNGYKKKATNANANAPTISNTKVVYEEEEQLEEDVDPEPVDLEDFYYDDVALDDILKSNSKKKNKAVGKKPSKPTKSESTKTSSRGASALQNELECSALTSSLELTAKGVGSIKTMRVPEYQPVCKSWYIDPNSTVITAEKEEHHPSVFGLDNSRRYRTYHGSHTVAANGGCQKDENYDTRGMKCSLEFDVIVNYQNNETHLAVPRANRIFRAYAESVEDIFLLSQSDVLFGQGSSYFSTLASYLVWARTGCEDFANSVVFLDQGHCMEGLSPSAHLHGMNLLNTTYGYDPTLVKDAGLARWKIHTDNFLPALQSYAQGVRLEFNPWDKKNYMRLDKKTLLPQLPEYFFYKEARAWSMEKYAPVWPGSCPGPRQPSQHVDTYVLETSNMGNSMHEAVLPGQAAQCWMDAKNAAEAELNRLEAMGYDPKQYSFLYNAMDVARGNLKTLLLMSYADIVINENVRDYFAVDENRRKKQLRPALLPPGFMENEDGSGDKPLLGDGQAKSTSSFESLESFDYDTAMQWIQLGHSKGLIDAVDSSEQIDAVLYYLNSYVDALNDKKKSLLEQSATGGDLDQGATRDVEDDDDDDGESDSGQDSESITYVTSNRKVRKNRKSKDRKKRKRRMA